MQDVYRSHSPIKDNMSASVIPERPITVQIEVKYLVTKISAAQTPKNQETINKDENS